MDSQSSDIECRDLVKAFGDIVAVDHLSFSVAQGEIFGLVGPDGAGKTTTMRMLSSLIEPTGGSARVAGHDVSKKPHILRRPLWRTRSATGPDVRAFVACNSHGNVPATPRRRTFRGDETEAGP